MSLETIWERQIRDRRKSALYAALLVLAALTVVGAFVWAAV